MAKGSRVVTCRLPPLVEAEVMAWLASRNEVTRGEPWGMSQFVQAAVLEKLAHIRRSKASGRVARSSPLSPAKPGDVAATPGVVAGE